MLSDWRAPFRMDYHHSISIGKGTKKFWNHQGFYIFLVYLFARKMKLLIWYECYQIFKT